MGLRGNFLNGMKTDMSHGKKEVSLSLEHPQGLDSVHGNTDFLAVESTTCEANQDSTGQVHFSARQPGSIGAQVSYWYWPEQQLCSRPSLTLSHSTMTSGVSTLWDKLSLI